MAGPTAQAVSSTGSNGVVLIRLESELNPTLCIWEYEYQHIVTPFLLQHLANGVRD